MTMLETNPVERPSATTHVEMCHCGQELDCCHGTHCPRCGATLPNSRA